MNTRRIRSSIFRIVLSIAMIASAAVSAAAEVPLPTAPTRYVTDAAGVLDDARESALNERLAKYEKDTTNQVIVYVDRRVPPGTTLEQVATAAINKWDVGQKQANNGAILFLFIDDRQSRIEVGDGLKASLTDAEAKAILVDLGAFQGSGDFMTATERGVERIVSTIGTAEHRVVAKDGRVVTIPKFRVAPPRQDQDQVQDRGPMGLIIAVAVIAGILGAIFYVTRKYGDGRSAAAEGPEPDAPPDPSRFQGGGGTGSGGGASNNW